MTQGDSIIDMIKKENNKFCEHAELVLNSASVAFAVAGLNNPTAAVIAPLISIAALSFCSI